MKDEQKKTGADSLDVILSDIGVTGNETIESRSNLLCAISSIAAAANDDDIEEAADDYIETMIKMRMNGKL